MKNKYIIKKNKYIIIICFFLLFIILFSFYQYFSDYYSYSSSYYEIKEKCLEQGKKEKICSYFSDKIELKNYIQNNDPKARLKKLDAITLTCEIVEHNFFSILQLLSPFLICICVIGTMHSEINSGMFKNYLTRTKYKKYLKNKIITICKISLVIPLSMLIVFLISCIITKFNFTINDSVKKIAVYSSWKYNNFIMYGVIMLILQYIMSFTYGMIGLICAFKNKNSIISIILSYVFFIIEELIIYIILYSVIINGIFGIKGLTEYFNIAGYWFFNENINYVMLLLIAFSVMSMNYIHLYFQLHDKEKVVIENEKQNS